MLDRARLATLAAVPLFVWRAWPSLWTTVDDAWISGRYAAQFAAGNGLVYNAELPAIEGYTNLAWTIWLGLGIAGGVDPVQWMVGSGLAFGALSVVAVGELSRAMLPVDAPGRRWGAVLAAWLLAGEIHHAVSATNGLETSMFTAGLLGACWVAWTRGAGVWTGVALGTLALVRPEGLLAGGAMAAALTWSDRSDKRNVGALWAGLLGVWLSLVAWRWASYGALLPNTFAAKAEGTLTLNLDRNLKYLRTGQDWFGYLAVALVAVPFLGRVDVRKFAMAVFCIGSVAASLRVYMWMPGARLLVPGSALILAMLGASVRSRIVALWMVLGLLLSLWLPQQSEESRIRRYDRIHSVELPNDVQRVATHLRQHLPPGSQATIRDAGVFAFFMGPQHVVIETHQRALTHPHPDGRPTDLDAVLPASPDVVVLTVADPKSRKLRYVDGRRILRRSPGPYTYLGRFHQHHRRYYDVYVRSDHDLPPVPESWVTNRLGPTP